MPVDLLFKKSWPISPAMATASRAKGLAFLLTVKLHYLMAGHGPVVGYAETSRMWRPLMRTLATRFTVIATDLPGIADSGIPSDGLDMAHAARRMRALVNVLGVTRAAVVGHDIGLMVAYAYAA